jgi:cellulose synthase/poly-beta-1,6-N-acetylglucosamine synthase-like glycosyltransferase
LTSSSTTIPSPRPDRPHRKDSPLTTLAPLVSILLLCRNEAVFLRRALRSVLAQTITDPIEIILVDDASVDRSADIARAEVAAHVATRHSAEALHATPGDAGFMATVPAEAVARIVPGAAVPDDRQSLRRLMSELFEMTIFRI